MSLLEWRDSYRIGIDEVDYEHRELIGLINAAHATIVPGAPSEQLHAALGEVYAVISAHFALEEKDMAQRRYPALAEHKQDHERLLDDLRDIMDETAERDLLDEAGLSRRLADWFSVHFRTHDARLHHYLRDGAGRGPAP